MRSQAALTANITGQADKSPNQNMWKEQFYGRGMIENQVVGYNNEQIEEIDE